ncbi:MAG: TolC family protein [Alphaproteobacteria bacterium]|nr:TolC family protein [Alphaproteobacteria bacterium]
MAVPSASLAETLEQAVSITLSQHPQVESAQAAFGRSRQEQKEEFSAYFPELNVTATGGRIYGDNSTSRGLSVTRGTGYSYLWEGSVSARQKIFDGMETRNRVGAARSQVKAAELALIDVRENLAYQTVQTYLNLLRVQKGLALLNGQQKTVAEYLQRIRTMVDDGAADEAELQQARDVSIILDNFIADYEGQARALESDYLELTGHLPESALTAPDLAVDKIPQDLESALVSAKEKHPLLRSAQFRSHSARQDMEAEKSTYVPKFDGELSFLKSDKADVIGGEVEDGRAVVRMNWGFETGGAQKARIKQRTYDYKESQARITEIERQVEHAIRQAYAEQETAQRQLENQKQRQDLNKKLLETYEIQFEGARISVLQLMQADNQALLTELETENTKSRVLIARYGILAAMGHLQEAMNIQLAASHPRHEK